MTFTATPAPTAVSWRDNRFQQSLTGLYAAVWIWAAIAPVSRMDWFLENLLVAAGVACLAWLYRTRPLSDLSALMVALFLALHTMGSHYTYSEVPVGNWVKHLLGLERNHYDRVVHFTFGLLLAYPLRELILRARLAKGGWSGVFAFSIVAACSALYEIMEWLVGAIVDPSAGMAFLGTQGDAFDSQKDSGLAIAGAAVALLATALVHRRK